jgi:hypothetical protein
MKWYKRLYYYLMDGNLPKHGAAPTSRSRIVNDPITWGDLCDKQPTWKMERPAPWPDPPMPSRLYSDSLLPKLPKQDKKQYYRVDYYKLNGKKLYWDMGFYQPIEYPVRLLAWSYWSSHDYYEVTIEHMTEEEFNKLPDFEKD